MKIVPIISTLFLLVLSFPIISQVGYELNETGKLDYKKLLPQNRAFQIYTKDAEKVFYLTPNHYFHLNGMTDTLEFAISGDSLDYSIQLKNEIEGFSAQLNDKVLTFSSGGKTIEFDVRIQKSKKNTRYSPIKDGILPEDEDFGMVITENRLIKYTEINLNDEVFNVAILDRDKNGIVDSNDLLCISFDEYFFTKENLKTTFLSDETIIKVGENNYKVEWDYGYKLRIEALPFHENPELILNHSVPDIILSDGNVLSNFVQQKDYTILSYWSEFSPSCLEAIPELNKLNNVVGFHLEGDLELENYRLNYMNYLITQEQLDNIGVNGYPYYVVVNRSLESIATFRFYSEIPEMYK